MPTPHLTANAPLWRRRAALFAGATVLASLNFSQMWLVYGADGTPAPMLFIALWAATPWYFWAAVAPLVAWLGTRIPVVRGNLLRSVPTHLGAALGLGLVSTVLVVILFVVTDAVPEEMAADPLWGLILFVSTWQLTINLLSYAAILGGSYAIDFYRRYQERELAASRLSQQLANAQLQALRMQLNPHFLFNAMNTVAMMVRKQENDAAVRTLAELSDLIRYVLEDTQSHEVPLRQELDFVRQYLALEQVRFSDRLNVRIDAPDDTLDARVPNLLLQPLVENAIRHGIARSAAASTVEIIVRRTNGQLAIEVLDDGPGLPNIPTTAGGGLGIHNTQERLKQMYGDQQEFHLRSREDRGAAASMKLPFHTGASGSRP
jgi:signal transduction histidine kinase